MALPIAPIAGFALRYGAVALAAYALAREVQSGRRDQRAEVALDDLAEGLSAHGARRDRQVNAGGRLRRVLRIGANGPGLEIDIALVGRVRLRRV